MSFVNDIKKFVRKTDKRFDLVFRGTCLSLLSKIIKRTPVLTGRLAGNWSVDINNIPKEIIENSDPEEAVGYGMLKLKDAVIGDIVYIANNLPYVFPIEYEGHSQKAPEGMVGITVAEYEKVVEEKARKAKGKW